MKKIILLFTGILISLNLSAARQPEITHFDIPQVLMQHVLAPNEGRLFPDEYDDVPLEGEYDYEELRTRYDRVVRSKMQITARNALKLKKVSGKLPEGITMDAKFDKDNDGYPKLIGTPKRPGTYTSSWKMTQMQNRKEVELCTIKLILIVNAIDTVPVINLIPERGITLNGLVYEYDNVVGTVSYTVNPKGVATLVYETEYGKKTLRTKQWSTYLYDYDESLRSSFYHKSNKDFIKANICITTTKHINNNMETHEKIALQESFPSYIYDSNFTSVSIDEIDVEIDCLQIRFSDDSVNAADFEGYYTVGMKQEESNIGGSHANGDGYLTLSISSSGNARYSGMLPNGQTFSGSTITIAEGERLIVPILKKAGKNDLLKGALELDSYNDVRSQYHNVIWEHNGTSLINDRYSVALNAFGRKYDKTADISTILDINEENYLVDEDIKFGYSSQPGFNNNGEFNFRNMVTDLKDKLQLEFNKKGHTLQRATFKFNKSTGIFSGTVTPIIDGKPVTAKYKGIVCRRISAVCAPERTNIEVGVGSYYLTEKVRIDKTRRTMNRIIGGSVVIERNFF